jgi:hypothetical protein
MKGMKEVIQEQAEISASKTEEEALKTEALCHLRAAAAQSLATSHQINEMNDLINTQNAPFFDMNPQLIMQNNYKDALPHDLRARNIRLHELLNVKSKLTSLLGKLNEDTAYKISIESTDFSDMSNGIIAWITASTALDIKITALQSEIKKPLSVESGESFSNRKE